MNKMFSKSRQPKIAIISIILIAGAFVFFVASYLVDSAYSTYLMVGGLALLIASWAVYFFMGKPDKSKQETPESVITVIGCKGCDFREERAFATGDYIFKEVGPCKKCQGVSYIRAIYSVTPKKE
jgi:hypothetical protein